jgi:hypothetical protein
MLIKCKTLNFNKNFQDFATFENFLDTKFFEQNCNFLRKNFYKKKKFCSIYKFPGKNHYLRLYFMNISYFHGKTFQLNWNHLALILPSLIKTPLLKFFEYLNWDLVSRVSSWVNYLMCRQLWNIISQKKKWRNVKL